MAVLIVEDEPSIADTIRYALETERIDNIWVTTGQQALDALSAGNTELVLLDIGLPDMSGFDVCRVIRQKSSVPVVFLTSRHEEIDQVLGLELGADDYITKPFSPGCSRPVSVPACASLRKRRISPLLASVTMQMAPESR
ncbi:response regulator [Nitrincola sp. A-D6]|uniref:response regulator n=1 Tax=Nitrincola sp. A-D6 TaxID=1545442 RepID=UPI000A959F7C|nr:response regulator [Nitrincola sp. A-D6]